MTNATPHHGYLLDMDGVLYRGAQPIPHAREFIGRLQQRGIPFLLLALGLGWATTALGVLRRHARGIQLGGAIVLVAIGLAMLTGVWGYALRPLQGTVLWL